MTSVPRDPAFWKRFSTAVHLSEGKPGKPGTPVELTPTGHEALDHGESWLEQQHRKKRRNRILIATSAVLLVGVLVLVILALIDLSSHGWYMHGEKFSFP